MKSMNLGELQLALAAASIASIRPSVPGSVDNPVYVSQAMADAYLEAGGTMHMSVHSPIPNAGTDPSIYIFDEASDLGEFGDALFYGDGAEQPERFTGLSPFQPIRKRQSVRTDLAAPTFKSKRVKANRKRKRMARKARRALA